tara:strand:+ start:11 stop:664 length:654 start_codon:yes stop_codon:yes gene_type:complete
MNTKLILIRHGQSTYNLENRFTGWKDVELTDKGRNEALIAARLIRNIDINLAYTSKLKRAQHTLEIVLNTNKMNIPITCDQSLNERDYGELIGQNKNDAAKQFGKEQVQIWRRSYNIAPPGGESLEMTYNRAVPYFIDNIQPKLDYNNIIISAHGNSIRAIVKYLLNLSPELILKTEIGWCEPWIFTFDHLNLTNLEIIYDKTYASNSHLPIDINSI